jgi:predicted nucleic acid-binding protein
MEAVRVFEEDVLSLINTEWIDKAMHEAGISALLTASRKKLSLVDCVCFEIMRNIGIKKIFAFDPHFEEQGFETISSLETI